jgi:nicotinate-nucleotide adenylyltransferase
MQIGILGGSFNPIHNGHLEIVRNVIKSNIIDNIWLLPSSLHPLKNNGSVPDFEIRLKLVKAAIIDIPACFAFDYDNQDSKPSYTDVLLQKLSHKFPQHTFHFIIGFDIIPEIHRWHNYQWLQNNARFISINRPGNYNMDAAGKLKNKKFIEMQPNKTSSTLIRNLIANKKSITGLIPPQIEQKIIALYQ